MNLAKKLLRFVQIIVLLREVCPKFLSKVPRFVLFLGKTTKNIEDSNFYPRILRSLIRGFQPPYMPGGGEHFVTTDFAGEMTISLSRKRLEWVPLAPSTAPAHPHLQQINFTTDFFI